MAMGLDREAGRAFLLLVAGHVLFAAGLWALVHWQGPLLATWLITPLFGLPLVAFGGRQRMLARALVLLIGFTAVHYLAETLAFSNIRMATPKTLFEVSFSREPIQYLAGALGGAAGAAGCFSLLLLTKFMPRDGKAIGLAVLGTLALTAAGAIGLYQLLISPGDAGLGPWLILYTPWQLIFAAFLALLMRAPAVEAAQ